MKVKVLVRGLPVGPGDDDKEDSVSNEYAAIIESPHKLNPPHACVRGDQQNLPHESSTRIPKEVVAAQ